MESPSNLELFVLAMVQIGLATPYDLKVKAGLSLGSTIPLLTRLEKAHLITGAKADARNSRKFKVTPAGAKQVRSASWEEIGRKATDVDSALRIAYLAWRFSGRRRAAAVLGAISERLKELAETRRPEAEQLSAAAAAGPPVPDAHRWLRLSYETDRLEADASALLRLAHRLSGRPPKKRRK